ncbi:MAG: Glu/Leu/Phe/Val dehydrogenase [Pseudomonadota bacterium]
MQIEDLSVPGWERVVRAQDEASGLDAIIAIHDVTLGPACGGCRFRPYQTFESALEDVTRLSKGMTYKNAVGNIPFGGGKAVIIADPSSVKRTEIFRAFGQALEALDGAYYTAEDSGVTVEDMKIVRSVTPYVTGIGEARKGGNPAPFTARGVFKGIEAAAAAKFGSSSLDGKRVAILGVGAVGTVLAELLHDAGASLVVADVNESATRKAAELYGAQIVSPDLCISQDVDIFSPCALGGSIRKETISEINAKIVAGAANNQLFTPDMDLALQSREILYAPDYVINAAGVISVGLEILESWTSEEITSRINHIGDTLTKIFERASAEKQPTGAIADAMALEIIAAAKMQKDNE